MPFYEYKCPECKLISTKTENDLQLPCSVCGYHSLKRLFSFMIKPSMPAHYNQSVGRYVTGERDFKDELKRASDRATEETGIPHSYVPVDLHDSDTFGANEEGMSAHHDRLRAEGKESSASRIII
jgi:hypothetical protein